MSIKFDTQKNPGLVRPEVDNGASSVQKRKNRPAVQLLRSWRMEDELEQKETLGYLMKVLDEDRPSDRKLFA